MTTGLTAIAGGVCVGGGVYYVVPCQSTNQPMFFLERRREVGVAISRVVLGVCVGHTEIQVLTVAALCAAALHGGGVVVNYG